jgi:membrane-bound ClpP family serine protease
LGVKTLHLKTISALVILTLFTLSHGAYQGHAANDDGRKIYYTLLKGTINNKLADDFEGVLKEAEKANAKVLILEIIQPRRRRPVARYRYPLIRVK